MKEKKLDAKHTKRIARIGIIAGLYIAVTFLLSAISFGPLQVRVSEALTLLPMIYPEAIMGLFLGCLLANLLGPYGAVDIICGSLVTLIAAFITYRFRHNSIIAYLSPILLNAFWSAFTFISFPHSLPSDGAYDRPGAGHRCTGTGIPHPPSQNTIPTKTVTKMTGGRR